jgi:hypothetical protein
MSTLTSKQISKTYKQLLKVNVSADTNTGVTGDLQQVQSGDGTNSALQISTSVIQVAGKFGVSEDASVSGDLFIGGAVCASAAFFSNFNVTNVTATGVVADKVCASAFFGDGSNLTNVICCRCCRI